MSIKDRQAKVATCELMAIAGMQSFERRVSFQTSCHTCQSSALYRHQHALSLLTRPVDNAHSSLAQTLLFRSQTQVCIVAYGQTGSGKTFTMTGGDATGGGEAQHLLS